MREGARLEPAERLDRVRPQPRPDAGAPSGEEPVSPRRRRRAAGPPPATSRSRSRARSSSRCPTTRPTRSSPSARTGSGRVRLRLPSHGRWLIKAVHMVPAGDAAQADWQSLWASLTFEIPGRQSGRKGAVKKGLVLLMLLAAALPACRNKSELPRQRRRRARRDVRRPGQRGGETVSAQGRRRWRSSPRKPRVIVRPRGDPGLHGRDDHGLSDPRRSEGRRASAARRPDRGDARRRRRLLLPGGDPDEGLRPDAVARSPAPRIQPEPNQGVAVGDTVPDFTLTDQTGRRSGSRSFGASPWR